MRFKLARVLFVVAAVGFLAGVLALVLCLEPSGWSDLSAGFVWYLLGRWPLQVLAPLGALTLGTALTLIVVVRRERREHPPLPGGGAREARGQELNQQALIRRARTVLDRVLSRRNGRGRPEDLDDLVDAILGLPVDLEVTGLSLEPDPAGRVRILLDLGDIQLPATSMAPELYARLLNELREMARVGEAGEGVVKLQSSRRLDRIRVALTHRPGGIGAKLEVLGESVSEARASQQGGRRRSNSVVFRLEPMLRTDILSGELPLIAVEENDATDPRVLDPSAEHEVAPLVEPSEARPVSPFEGALRLALAGATTLLVVFFFWHAYAWGLARMAGRSGEAPWREIALQIRSTPVPGEVRIQGRPSGRTPLSTRAPCRGRAIEILVQARGYATWQWNGVCPERGPLELDARLRPAH
jgi:hypothetical protein